MTTTIEISNAMQQVTEAVERIKNDATQHFPEAASVGDAVRQGDIYIQKIDDIDEPPVFYKRVENPNPQLAPGDNKGSRHVLASLAGVEVFEPVDSIDARTSDEFKNYLALYAESTPESTTGRSIDWRSRLEAQQRELQRAGRLLTALTLRGPILRVKNTVTVTHPEHGDWVLPTGTYQITYQRTVDSARQIARVLD